jgi:hypothetical protein
VVEAEEVDQTACSVVARVRLLLDARYEHHEERVGAEAATKDVGKATDVEGGLYYEVYSTEVGVLLYVALYELPRQRRVV